MPKYVYRCNECDTEILVFHSMSSKLTDCEKCDAENSLVRIFGKFTTKIQNEATESPIGSVVKSSINEFKEDLIEEKKKLKSQLYEPDTN